MRRWIDRLAKGGILAGFFYLTCWALSIDPTWRAFVLVAVMAIVWDVLDPAWLDRVVAFAGERGFEPYFLLDSSEEAAFRQRFAGSALARLDWPPLIEIAPQVRVYRPGDRDRYLRGESRPTEYVR